MLAALPPPGPGLFPTLFPVLAPGCAEAPHPRHGNTCSQCVSSPHQLGCSSCIRLGFDCTCACGTHSPRSRLYVVNRGLAVDLPDIFRPDSYKWAFFRPFGAAGKLQGLSFARLFNLSGWEAEASFEHAFARWRRGAFERAARPHAARGRAWRSASRLGAFVHHLAAGRPPRLRALPEGGAAEAAAGAPRVLIVDPCAPTGLPEKGLAMCYGGAAVPALMHLDLHAQLSRQARRMGLRVDALVLAEPTPRARNYLLREFDDVLVYPLRAAAAELTPLHLQRTAAELRTRGYAAVVTWTGFLLGFADELARALGVRTRYLGRHAVNELDKVGVRQLLVAARAAGATPYRRVRSVGHATIHSAPYARRHPPPPPPGASLRQWVPADGRRRARPRGGGVGRAAANATGGALLAEDACFPCFLKVASTVGGSAGRPQLHSFSGRINDEPALEAAARELLGGRGERQTFILERYLHGPEVFAEVLVHRAELLRLTFRALKLPLHSHANPERGEAALWQWPAVLTPRQHALCSRVAAATVAALDLQSGAFGIQLVLDEEADGCAFLEINMRPHSWPLLHDEAVQLYFGDVWLYSEMSIRIALNQSREVLESRMTERTLPPPYQMTAICHGSSKGLQLFYIEWLMWRQVQGLCNVTVQPFSGAWATN
ncbi:hypothetical protein AB1Y20_017643 [Prymnesium parvum]|uniref:ATP-grasp domain-containing protein n=1 Tax=Prymnesium parvum TaxID=97485 RepID=A0AB34JMD5_PRYPA